MTLSELIKKLIGIEGGFVDDPNDSGGKTRYGITERLAREYGYNKPMRDFPIELAILIYRKEFIEPMRIDRLLPKHSVLAMELIECVVNIGAFRTTKFLQRSLNVLNNRELRWSDLKVDGIYGSQTDHTLHIVLSTECGDVLPAMINSLQGAFYIELAENRVKDEAFIYGWFKKRVLPCYE